MKGILRKSVCVLTVVLLLISMVTINVMAEEITETTVLEAGQQIVNMNDAETQTGQLENIIIPTENSSEGMDEISINNVTADQDLVQERLRNIRATTYPDGSKFESGGFQNAWQCFGFAKKIQYMLFGIVPGWDYNGSIRANLVKVTEINKGNFSRENIKTFMDQALPGDIIQADVGWYLSYPHSMIFCWRNTSETFTIYEANYDNANSVHMIEKNYSNWVNNNTNKLTLLRSTNYPQKEIAPADTTPPSISSPQITDVNASGFTVSCNVSDNVGVARVLFPTWTTADGQDDIIWHEGWVNGNIAGCRVNFSDHKNSRGEYAIHIYAYDNVGNVSSIDSGGITIDSTPPTITDAEILNRTPLGYTVKCKVADASGIDRVQFPTWTSANDQDDIQQSWWSNPVASGKIEGDTVTYQVNDADHNYERGVYNTHIYAYDKFGNYTCVTLGTTVENNGSAVSEEILNNHRYMIYDDAVTWAQAEAKAEELGGTLATISSQDEQTVVEKLIGAGQRARYFLGGTDEGQEGTFRWVNGEPFGLAKWAPGNPDNWSGNENYLQITREGYWNDVSGSYNAGGYIVEVDANKLQIANFKASDDTGSYTNRNISLSADISGGVVPIQYKFYYKLDDASTIIQDYTETNTVSFKPTLAGTYTLYVDAKDSEGRTATKSISNYVVQKNIGITYQTQIQNIGWQEPMSNGIMSGTSGKGLRLEGIKINLDKQGYDIGVSYQTHIENIGWEANTDRGWKSNGVMSGTEGLGYRLEAIQIKLTGADADQFDIYYQVHAQNFGWLDWAKNGESSGTAGFGNRLEAINVVVVPKNVAAPGTTEKPFVQK